MAPLRVLFLWVIKFGVVTLIAVVLIIVVRVLLDWLVKFVANVAQELIIEDLDLREYLIWPH